MWFLVVLSYLSPFLKAAQPPPMHLCQWAHLRKHLLPTGLETSALTVFTTCLRPLQPLTWGNYFSTQPIGWIKRKPLPSLLRTHSLSGGWNKWMQMLDGDDFYISPWAAICLRGWWTQWAPVFAGRAGKIRAKRRNLTICQKWINLGVKASPFSTLVSLSVRQDIRS